MQITFRPDGTAEHLGDASAPEAAIAQEIGQTKTRRASHIEPVGFWLRLAFHALRGWANFVAECNQSEDSDLSREIVIDWTRRWKCNWRVRVVNGPTFGCYADRSEAIAAEIAWLQENRL
jgi:hypothetical protein